MGFWEKFLDKDKPLSIKERKKDAPEPAPEVTDDRQGVEVGPAPGQTQLGGLHQLVDRCFNMGELRDLCFELGVDYDDLPGGGKTIKSRELLRHLERNGRMDEFVAVCSRLRPNVSWDTFTAPRHGPYGRDQLADLHRAVKEHLNEDQVRELCASLEVDYRRLPYVEQGGATRELVLYLARRGRLAELIQACSQRRPDVPWADILARKGERPDVARPVDRAQLRQTLLRFDENDLRDMCLELGVDYDDLSGAGQGAKVRELIVYFERRGRTDELVAACARCTR